MAELSCVEHKEHSVRKYCPYCVIEYYKDENFRLRRKMAKQELIHAESMKQRFARHQGKDF
jgi:vesicle coat complex subunit